MGGERGEDKASAISVAAQSQICFYLGVLVEVDAPARRVVIHLVRRRKYFTPGAGVKGAGPEPQSRLYRPR